MFKLRNFTILFSFQESFLLISNLMPATDLKIVGTGACVPWCNISTSFQNSFKMSGHRGYEFLEFWCWNLVPFLPDIGFQLLKIWSVISNKNVKFGLPVPTILRSVAGIKFEMSRNDSWNENKIVKFLSLNICNVIYVILWIKCWLIWFESLLVFILFKLKKRPNISGIRVVVKIALKKGAGGFLSL